MMLVRESSTSDIARILPRFILLSYPQRRGGSSVLSNPQFVTRYKIRSISNIARDIKQSNIHHDRLIILI